MPVILLPLSATGSVKLPQKVARTWGHVALSRVLLAAQYQPNRSIRLGMVELNSIWLTTVYIPVSDVASRQHLQSASLLLVVSRHRLSIYGLRAFAVAGPTVWHSLPDNLRDPDVTIDYFKRLLKTFFFCFQRTSVISATDVSRRCALQIYVLLTYLLTSAKQ